MKKRPCKTCPFKKGAIEPGALDWLLDIMKGITHGNFDHTCHMTDSNADLYAGIEDTEHCVGFLGMIKKQKRRLVFSKRAFIDCTKGKFSWNDISTEEVFDDWWELIKFHANASKIDLSQIERMRPRR